MNSEQCKDIGLEFENKFYRRCAEYTSLLQQWGKVHNLTAELQDEKIDINILDSIYPLKFLNDFKSFADIGTGAGYPGLLIAIARPDVLAVLIEPRRKRVAFLNFVKNALDLKNVEIICDRVENVKDRSFDLITSRAVTNTSLLMEITKGISSSSTEFLFYKGSMLDNEIQDASLKNYEIINVKDRNYLYIKNEGQ
ncbi:MAG: 16S rRNA (guanine(527)-N(7))-methyltransferase RsmG [Campylobacteraceae bacterium]|nr:16S rRNA (guanine(527)-N(7))-methyltransferase RsmG [Campylobacteraceae bacterium]